MSEVIMFNKKGTTLMEVIISIALISIVLGFMIKLLVDLNNMESNNEYAKGNQINRAEITRTILDDIRAKEITRVTDIGSNENELVINFQFDDSSYSTIRCNSSEITYIPTSGEADIRKWTLNEGEIYVPSANVYYNRRVDEEGNFRIYTLTIDIEIHTPNDINNVTEKNADELISYNNTLDDIIINYVGTLEIDINNVTCFGYACNNEFANGPLISDVAVSSNINSITLAVTASPGDNPISTYYYSINNGQYISSNNNTYIFNDLATSTEYNFRVYAVDTMGYMSNVYELTASTSDYVNPTVNSVTVTDKTASSISVSVNASGGTNSVDEYYYSINNGSYVSSRNNTYTFSGLNKNTSYQINVYVEDTNNIASNNYEMTDQTDDITNLCNPGTNLASCIISLYSSDGVNALYRHDGTGTYGSMEAGDNSYRYTGENPNNYVCFGSNSTNCPSDNLYQIIGVFGNQVKLLKRYFYKDNLSWSCTNVNDLTPCGAVGNANSNDWSISQLNSLLNNLYLDELGSTWENKIATTTWYVGGGAIDNIRDVNARTTYRYEVGQNRINKTYKAKVALMYVSDFSYAAEARCWSYPPTDYNTANQNCDNWMKGGLTEKEWTLSPITDNKGAYSITHSANGLSANINVGSTLTYSGLFARPSFYLNSSVTYTSGMGTMDDPIRIN